MSTCKIKLDKEKGGGIKPLNVAFSFYISLNKRPCQGVVTETTSFNDSEEKIKYQWDQESGPKVLIPSPVRDLISGLRYLRCLISTLGILMQHSPTFLAPRTSFMEDKFSMDSEGGGVGFRII